MANPTKAQIAQAEAQARELQAIHECILSYLEHEVQENELDSPLLGAEVRGIKLISLITGAMTRRTVRVETANGIYEVKVQQQ